MVSPSNCRLPAVTLLIAFAVLWVAPFEGAARAQTLGAVEQRLNRLEQSLRKLERRDPAVPSRPEPAPPESSGGATALMELNGRLVSLERLVATLVSAREQDHRDLAMARDQLQRLKGDVETRLDGVERQVSAMAPAQSAPVAASEPVAKTPDERYAEALGFAEAGQWARAEFAFDTFIANNPAHPRLAEARFWLGRSLLAEGKAAPAAQIFLDLYGKHPTASFALDNLLALAKSLEAIGPDSAAQACDVYAVIADIHGDKLTVELRSLLLDRRLALQCPA